MQPEPADLSALFSEAARALAEGPHPDRARLDAEFLLVHLLQAAEPARNRAWLLTHGGDPIPSGLAAQFRQIVERRLLGEPIQYITGQCEFYGLPFRVTPAVLIPRRETEHLVEWVQSASAHFPQPRIVDIGTGSGAIAIALAHLLPNAIVTATDISADAVTLARQNSAANRLDARIRFLTGDLLAPVAGEQFEVVVCNPPYVPLSDHALLAAEVRDHEPALALYGGSDGLAIVRRLIPAAYAALVSGGIVALEIGFSQAEAVQALLAEGGFHQVGLIPDLQGIPRVATALRS